MAKVITIKITDDLLEMLKELAKKKNLKVEEYLSEIVRAEHRKLG